ncbi:energy transducer TonB [Algoriphagus aquimarinus]|uniref:TonB family C-terminal domain-containing protein n=1 Tax=Algoriphagus aquimarinus TaxID=237018 RepID=A0A1I1AL78_9BACT|nr:energy transducer TonB [Algoriphagus aquimarinus]SFB37170.1 TonB family C-terminal domain-containing protein [Algoriphagus aquimarinus]
MKLSIPNFQFKVIPVFLITFLFFAVLPNLSVQAQTEGEDVLMEVDEMPKPKGGYEGWNAYLSQNLKYPEAARERKIEGTVIAIFVVDEKGEVSNVEILRGIGGGCDEEVMRLVKESPKWTPGKKDGEIVKVKMRLPVRFKL